MDLPCQACGSGSLITLIWQRRPVIRNTARDNLGGQLKYWMFRDTKRFQTLRNYFGSIC